MTTHFYSRFEVTRVDGTKVKLRIEDMREGDKENFIEFMQKHFIPEETNFRAAGIADSDEARKEIIYITRAILQDKRAYPLVCYVDNDDQDKLEIVGCNALNIKRKQNKSPPPVQTEECKALFRITKEYDQTYDLATKIDVDEYLRGAGLVVHPNYRRCGIATELVKARKPMIERRGFKVTSAWFTTLASQKAGLKAGYEEVAEITHEELGRRAGVTFTDCPPSAKYMIMRA